MNDFAGALAIVAEAEKTNPELMLAITTVVKHEIRAVLLEQLLGERPPDLPDRPALHVAAPIRAKAVGPLQAGGCEAIVCDGSTWRRCSHPANTARDGHPCCGQHVKTPAPRWADADGDGYTGI
jgi:hypothetical protein